MTEAPSLAYRETFNHAVLYWHDDTGSTAKRATPFLGNAFNILIWKRKKKAERRLKVFKINRMSSPWKSEESEKFTVILLSWKWILNFPVELRRYLVLHNDNKIRLKFTKDISPFINILFKPRWKLHLSALLISILCAVLLWGLFTRIYLQDGNTIT